LYIRTKKFKMKEQDLKLKIAELKDTIVFLRKELELIKNKNKMENKETLEEANWKVLGTKNDTFYNGAKWKEERMYSEEDLIDFAHFYFIEEFNSSMQTSKSTKDIFNKWFEQFKKK
jgi:hypothetical protein